MLEEKIALGAVNGFFKRAGERLYDLLEKHTIEPRDLKKVIEVHLGRTREMTGSIKILGMTEPLPIEQVYYPTRVSDSIRRRLFENTWTTLTKIDVRKRLRKDPSISQPGLDAIGKSKRMVVLGGPGSGKTTFLKYLALTHARDDLFDQSKLPKRFLPFFVHLPVISKENADLFEYLAAELTGARKLQLNRALEALFERGEAIIILDSLDEVPLTSRPSVVRSILAFFKRFPALGGIVSCRTADYSQTIDGFKEVEVARLDRRAIDKIVRGWFQAETSASEAPDRARKLLEIIDDNEDVENLAETPLLLSLICIQFSHDLRIPNRKVELYRRCLEALLSRWDSSRNFRRDSKFELVLTDDRKERLLEYLSEIFYSSARQFVLSESEMNAAVATYCEEKFQLLRTDAPSIIDELERHHGLVERFSADSFCFSHPSFQEYFYARRLDRQGVSANEVTKILRDVGMSSVVEFLVALREDPRDILEKIMTQSRLDNIKNYPAMTLRIRHLIVLYRCLVSGPAIGRDFALQLYSHTFDSLRNIFRIFRDSAIYPFPELRPDGIRLIYFLGEKGRETLKEALLYLRVLSNEILRMPHEAFADYLLRASLSPGAEERLPDTFRNFERACLLIPLASARPVEVIRFLEHIVEGKPDDDVLSRIHKGSIEVIRTRFIKGQ
jgi:energy-coupling factor transporter ATP-binding protein EcfA2